MIHVYEPSIDAPTEQSPDWYRNYHNLFNICHLTNVLLLSYMESFIRTFEFDSIVDENKESLTKSGKLSEKRFLDKIIPIVDDDHIFNLAVKSFLQELVENNANQSSEIKERYSCMGINVGDYFKKNVNVNLDELLNSLPTNNWYLVVKGFLNVWEFMFLFSAIESNLKEILRTQGIREKVYTTELIEKISDKYPDILNLMSSVHHFSKEISFDVWSIFTEIRNIYAHTHGMLNDKNIHNLNKRIKQFRKSYHDSFKEIKSPSDFILSSYVDDADEFFDKETLISGRFYLIPDNELNIFRNFSSKFMTLLSHLDK
ncbi:hypothetical protein ABRP92_11225 [Pectobacterium aroidearum]|uniref:hypothetical protein n=1 Tax=Pectobacterium aroidearum TaxID=1201031 RepID=UPI0032ED4DD0